jgi:hypothetical protein
MLAMVISQKKPSWASIDEQKDLKKFPGKIFEKRLRPSLPGAPTECTGRGPE